MLSLNVLKTEWSDCKRCGLHKTRDGNIAFGKGSSTADFLIVGTHPSEADVNEEKPFSGPVREFLRDLLAHVSIDVKNVYFTQVLGCRPTVTIPATEDAEERVENRKPDRDEVMACRPRLNEIIYRVDPRIIITMGELPLHVLVGGRIGKLTAAQNKLYEAKVPGRLNTLRYPVIATLDPEFIMKNPLSSRHGPVTTTTEAFKSASRYVYWVKRQEQESL